MSQNQKCEIDGYIHNVSEIHVAKSGSRYFDFTMQENVENRRVVCFSPEKRPSLKVKEEGKSPVRLANISPQKRKYDPETTEYIMNKYSRVEIKKNLSFPWKSSIGQSTDVVSSVHDVLSSKANGELVEIKAKVMTKSKTESVFSPTMQKSLKKADLLVADSSSAIGVTVWEDNIDKIEENASYLFRNLRISFFNRTYLNATKNTEFQVLDENIELSPASIEALDALKPKENVNINFTGRIIGVEVTRSYICLNCKYRINDKNNFGAVMKCPSCNISMLNKAKYLNPFNDEGHYKEREWRMCREVLLPNESSRFTVL